MPFQQVFGQNNIKMSIIKRLAHYIPPFSSIIAENPDMYSCNYLQGQVFYP